MLRQRKSGIILPDRVEDIEAAPFMSAKELGGKRWRRIPQPGDDDFRPMRGGARQYFDGVLGPLQTVAGTQITGTAEADLLLAATYAVIPTPLDVGVIIRLTAGGVMTTASSTPGTLTMTPRWGTTTSGTTLGAAPVTATLATSASGVGWDLRGTIMSRVIGASGVVTSTTTLLVPLSVLATDQPIIASTVAAGVTVNTTTAGGYFVGMTLGAAGDLMTTGFVFLESLT